MRVVEAGQTALLIIRNLYIGVMFVPLWLWSGFYRYNPGGWAWLNASWGVFSILALIYGAFGLWFFAERAVEAHYKGKPSRSMNISVWAIAITLFVACLGAVIDQGSNGWGKALFLIGTVLLPLVLLYSLFAWSHTPSPKIVEPEEAGVETPQEMVIEEHQ